MKREERQLAAYEQVAREVEKLVYLVQESQRNQHEFMQEAYRLLHGQRLEFEELRTRAGQTDEIKAMLDDVVKQLGNQLTKEQLEQLSQGIGSGQVQVIQHDGGMKPDGGYMPGAPGAEVEDPDWSSGGMTAPGAGEQPGAFGMPGVYGQPSGTIGQPSGTVQPGDFGAPGTGMGAAEQGTFQPVTTVMAEVGAPEEGAVEGTAEGAAEGEIVPPSFAEPEVMEVVKPVSAGSQMRFYHASPDTPGVDIYVDGKKVASGVDYEGISPYLAFTPGRHRVQVFPFRKTVGAIIDTPVNLKPHQHYTIAVAGMFKNVRSVVIEDSPSKGKPGFARLKIVHLSPDAPAIDVVTVPTNKKLSSFLTFKEKTPYYQVTPGRRDLEVRLANQKEAVLKVPQVRFDSGLSYTLYIIGSTKMDPKLSAELLPEA